MASKQKTFDCVRMKRELQDKFLERTKGMTDKELIQYLHQTSQKFRSDQGSERTRERSENYGEADD